ncbi:uncharacterized protein LOC126736533 [Anthonomus grandis grandis]|uniref:uncharacterized protein LOC126736533 n=1 Tax=Anthonomus grandis grandis TaxID=2921223 RepID=UPI0021651BE9|nr:uncharacterized protein LOC126736533 [Anthonomus grandis grandis]XP_050296883.1 uncharacterized protein LOC126736533 [Anthonomus grandis grandis]XP_050296884.1 uncharacterized protein LOC126736533 [Anthonomus grandis grandis]
MQRVFKIKTKSQPDVASQYPSERRYSASIVLGLSAVLMLFCLCSLLMGGLIIYKTSIIPHSPHPIRDKLEKDAEYISDPSYIHYYVNVPILVATGCFLMAFGNSLTFVSGIFAWKKWYIDHNIMFFFLSCSFSTLTSVISLLISALSTSNMTFHSEDLSPISLPLASNVIVLSAVNVIWSIVASKIAYRGMRNRYPDDIMTKSGNGVEVSRVIKKGAEKNVPIEVMNNFVVGKMAQYLPKKENKDLPKQESDAEYNQRVSQFLSDKPDGDEARCDEKDIN